MKLIEISAPDFDLAMTLASGQVFHWERFDNGFVGNIGEAPVYVEQRGDVLKVRCAGMAVRVQLAFQARETRELRKIVGNYFALDHPLAEICASFPNDAVMSAARHFCRGLRIIRQPKWECLATFIASTRKKVAH